MILSDWLYIPYNEIEGDGVARLRRLLTFTPKKYEEGEEPEDIILYRETEKYFVVPRCLPLNLLPVTKETINNITYDVSWGQEHHFPKRPDPNHPAVKDPVAQRQFMDDLITTCERSVGFLAVAATGCVSGDTEYLTQQGWRSIDKYSGEDIAVFDINTDRVTFEQPLEYINTSADYWTVLHTKYGIHQKLCPSHEILYTYKGQRDGYKKITARDFVDRQKASRSGFSGKIPCAFYLDEGTGPWTLGLSEWEVRLQVACMADAHYSNQTRRASVRIKKSRKKERLRYLLEMAGVDYREREMGYSYTKGFSEFVFYSPMMAKRYDSRFWGCSRKELEIIADECVKWDGSGGNKFFSKFKEDCDFIQYAFSATGRRALLTHDTRSGKESWFVHVTSRTHPTMQGSDPKSKASPQWEKAKEGERKYCFRTRTGCLVLRYKGSVFVTGNSGKTVCSLNTIAELGCTALAIAPTNAIANQWRESAINFLGLREDQIGTLQGSKIDIEGKPLSIGIVNSVAMREYPEWVYSYFGTVVCDEVHRVGSQVFSRGVPKFKARYRFGLSATPKRKDGADNVIQWHIGPIRVKSYADAVPCEVRVLPYETTKDTWGNNHGSRVKCLTLDPQRNNLIANTVHSMYSEGGNVLVVSDSIPHVQKLMEICGKIGIPHEEMGQFTGQRYLLNGKKKKITDEELQGVKDNARVIFATYGMMKEGTDIPRLDRGIDASPRTDAIQLLGRIRRPHHNKMSPVWYTIVDNKWPIFRGYFRKRLAEYQKENMRVTYL